MMTIVRNILPCLLLYAMLLSCSEGTVESDNDRQQLLSLLVSVGRTGQTTRQGVDVVQDANQSYRGLQKLLIVPFRTEGAVTATDFPLLSTAMLSEVNRVTGSYFYYMENFPLMSGTNRMLIYGQAAYVSGKEQPEQNGKLETALVDRMLPADIRFSLKPIYNSTAVQQEAQDLADYLTFIATTPGWSTTPDAQMKGLYLDFIHTDPSMSGVMAGSAAHVKAYVSALKTQLQAIDGELCNAIIARIDDAEKNACLSNGYPSATLGLPDGAAALRWIPSESAFSVRTTTTTLDNINGINRYTYPAELWYYANSGIRTSEESVGKSTYSQTNEGWNDLLTDNYNGSGSVNSRTRAVAVEDPLQYAVGRLKMTLNTISGPLRDAKNRVVSNAYSATLPLSAVIIGGQHAVGFDFKPMGVQSDVDACFIYDRIVGNTGTVNTLVLQSYDEEKVPIVLEFENKTGIAFAGEDGTIYPDTKFYLIAEVDPAGKGTGSYANRVFTQDHTTIMTMSVQSLAHAYAAMPDLLSPRLEIGVQVKTEWVQSTTTTVKL